jgi:hypothetical protein
VTIVRKRNPDQSKRQAAQNADDLEFEALQHGSVPYDRGVFDDRLADLLEDEYPVPSAEELPAWAEREALLDFANAEQMDVIEQRAEILGDAYPFRSEDGALTYRGAETLAYEFCLAASKADNVTTGDLVNFPRAFERFAGRTLACSLGHGGEWYRSGWPPDGDRPERIKDVVDELRQKTGEWLWNALPQFEEDPGPKDVKDGKIDLVVWKSFTDKRVGNILLLGQCACGNGWHSKLEELDPEKFRRKWLRTLNHSGEQLRFMAIPFHIPDEPSWIDACIGGGLILDRIRLTLLANKCAALRQPHKDNFLDLIKLVIPGFVSLSRNS